MKLSPKQREALKLVSDGKFIPTLVKEEDGWYARWRVVGETSEGVEGWVDEFVRTFSMSRLSEDAEEQKHETLHDAWILALRSRTGRVIWDENECKAFASELKEWGGNASEDRVVRSSIIFTFSAHGTDPASLNCEVTCAIPKGCAALKALGQAAYIWRPLVGLKRCEIRLTHLGVQLTRQEAEDFLRQGASDLRDAGYQVEGVDCAAAITASAEIAESACTEKSVSVPLTFTIRVAGEAVTADEIRFLLDQGSSFVYFRDRWIEVDRSILKEALRALEKGAGKKTLPLAFALGIGHVGRLELEEVKTHGYLRGLVDTLREHATRAGEQKKNPSTIQGFEGTLRSYQLRGVEWLHFLTAHGFGALLADDMGLGKTIQVIAWILRNHNPKSHAPILIVAPLTLLSNWKHEFATFAPSLKVYVHQGAVRHVASGFSRAVKEADVTLTSYQLLVRDYNVISEVAWDALILDEAQMIKNPDTQVSRAVCALMPPKRLALTGTPIENSVADLWALEAFLNPGFLGERREFTQRFVKPIAVDEQSSAGRRLRYALEPFLLRRLKSDKAIAAELGEKREIREYCSLTSQQRRDYEKALSDFRAREHTPGDVFALITELKLICDGEGKLERLFELVETIFANGESVLVFTQYAKVGLWLQNELAKRFGRKFPFLHGALSVRAREAQIREFHASRRPTLFLLSLKAGGFGLNLTKATHVIHFDRWWNPAVENQATDRVHRIGQIKTVFIHLFICSGTLEEHVDDILRRKARVADTVITEAQWLEAAKLDE